ncbi:MAG TPA: hypothetical protein PK788_06990 [Gemmatimonadaceae bacterium]|nr:hypothetical protein [Gemmatimonadaceae bacterium]HRQ77875.1 hypothetical protein [Gemmatimonadaceae bacterium]
MKRFIILSALALAACGGSSSETVEVASAPVSPDVTLALTVAEGIQAAPAMADSILQANGLTRAGFDSLLYKIAADSALSAQYGAGRR